MLLYCTRARTGCSCGAVASDYPNKKNAALFMLKFNLHYKQLLLERAFKICSAKQLKCLGNELVDIFSTA